MTRAVLWDFDGTLAYRSGMWSAALLEALDAVVPGHGVAVDALRPGLRGGFPWHTPLVGHSFASGDAWWEALGPVLVGACTEAGVVVESPVAVVAAMRACYVDPARWSVYDDVVPALTRLAAYRHVVVSNHVPELPSLVSALGLAPYFAGVVTSAAVGWEKPHREIFAAALAVAGGPDEVWMVGDNVVADVGGAEALGIPAILVRSGSPQGVRCAAGLAEAVALILG